MKFGHYHRLVLHLASLPLMLVMASPASARPDTQNEQVVNPETLLALDRQAVAAFFAGDSERYASLLSDSFVMHESGMRFSKADAVQMVESLDCDVDDWSIDEPRTSAAGDAAFALSYTARYRGACRMGDQVIKLPSLARVSTLWVLDEGEWRAAYHGENAIPQPGATADSDAPEAADRSSESTSPTALAISDYDALAGKLMQVETAVWHTWKQHDALQLARLTARDISFVNIFGDYYPDKPSTIANWTGPLCDVEGFVLSDARASRVAPGLAVLTLTGRVSGRCADQRINALTVYATTVYVKNGELWQWAFGFNSP